MIIRLLIIAITTMFMYRRTVNYGYIIDDIEVSAKERRKSWLFNLWGQLRGHAYFNPATEHTITLLIHTLNSMLIYLAFGANNVAFLAAMLFSVNPINNQASVWLSGKVYAVAATCILFGLWLKPLFPLTYFVGYYFSLNGIFTPLLFLFMPPVWFVALLPILTFAFKKHLVGEPKRRYDGSSPWMQEISLRKLIISLRTYGYYFRIVLFPTRLGMCHTYLHIFGLSKKESEKWYTLDKYFWLGVGLFLTLVVGVFMKWNILGLFWFTLLIAQWCNFIVLNHPICERYAYLAGIGLMYMISSILLSIPYGTYIAVVLFVYYATRLWSFLPAYRTNLDYFKSNITNFPDVAIGYNQVGLEAIRHGYSGTALETFVTGLQYRPEDFRLNYNTANLLLGMGRFQETVGFTNRADVNLDPKNNYDVWKPQVDNIKNKLRENGVQI